MKPKTFTVTYECTEKEPRVDPVTNREQFLVKTETAEVNAVDHIEATTTFRHIYRGLFDRIISIK